MGDLTLYEALAGGAFDHLNCQHTGALDQNFSKKSNAWEVYSGTGEGMGSFGISCFILKPSYQKAWCITLTVIVNLIE